MAKLRVGLAQIGAVLGDVERNLESHLRMISEAKAQHIELLCFPELSLTGYLLKDLAQDVALSVEDNNALLQPLIAASQDLDLLVGFPERDRRHRFYISAAYLSRGEIVHTHRKVYLPTYGMFEEGRYFAPGSQLRAFDTRLGRVGVLICEDFWHMSSAYSLWLDGADILLFVSASPGRGLSPEAALGSSLSVEMINQTYATFLTNFVLHCNRVGFEDGLNFWGGSTIFGPDGKLIARAPYFEEYLLTADLDLGSLRRVRVQLPLLRDERAGLLAQEMARMAHTGSCATP